MATIAKQTIYLNLRPGAVMPVLHVSQGDSGLESLEFKLINEHQPWTIPAAVADIQLNGATSVGVFSYNDPTWSGNTVTANVTETMTAEKGVVICELRLLDATLNSIGTLNFVISVEPSPYTNAHVSTSDMATIMAALNGSQQNMLLSKSWAVGDTGMREGEDTNNSKWWSSISESWAVGGTGDRSGEDTNNSKYYADQSRIEGNGLASVFSDALDYSAGDYVIHDGILYEFTVDHSAGAWNLSDVHVVNMGDEVADLKNERPYVTPEMYGAYGDGVHDDSTAIQSAINASLTNGIRLLAKGKTYLVGTGLRIVGNRNQSTLEVETGNDIDIDFSTSKIKYTGTDYAFTLSMINKGVFRFGNIDAPSGGGIIMQSDTRFNYISYLGIIGGSIAANATKDCITVTNSGTGWTNQNRIENILFMSGLYAVHMISNSTNKINEWIIENVSLEGVENGHYLEAHSESDIAVYIESIKFLYNRAVEHIGSGKVFLKTYGRVQDILVESYYGSFQSPAAYDFGYDNSGTQTYTHTASKIEIVSQNAKCRVINGKFISNPFMYDGACAITHISSISDAADVAYRNYYGTLKEFADAGVMPYYGLLSDGTEANLNTRWLAGSPTDTAANKRLEQTLYTRAGTAFKRGFINNNFSDWLMSPMVKAERMKLHQKTFGLDINAWGILVISTLNLSYVEAYFVRFGVIDDPVKFFTSNSSMTQWTLTRPSIRSVYFENTSFQTSEMLVSFLQLG